MRGGEREEGTEKRMAVWCISLGERHFLRRVFVICNSQHPHIMPLSLSLPLMPAAVPECLREALRLCPSAIAVTSPEWLLDSASAYLLLDPRSSRYSHPQVLTIASSSASAAAAAAGRD